MDSASSVTVVVPCYDQRGVEPLLARLRVMRKGPAKDWRFVFVDDGSTDDTFAALLRAARDDAWATVLRHPEKRGPGGALRTAFAHVDTAIVCTIDSDCSHPPERLPELTALIEKGADIATVAPAHPRTAATTHTSRIQLLLSRGVAGIYKRLVGQDVHYFTCPFRAYRREVLQRITFRADGVSAHAELLIKAVLSGSVIKEVSIPAETARRPEPRIGGTMLAHAHLIALTTLAIGARQARQVRWR